MAGDHAKLVATNFIREIKGQCLQQYAHSEYFITYYHTSCRASVVGVLIQAIGEVDFKDGFV